MKTKTSPTNWNNHSSCRWGRVVGLLIPVALTSLALSPVAQAVCQEGCDTSSNTFLGEDALLNNTGSANTAIGANALLLNTTGFYNTATGNLALGRDTTGSYNTANGAFALFANTTGAANTAAGTEALFVNTTGGGNTATGYSALYANGGDANTATGAFALLANTTGYGNTATGDAALFRSTTGSKNVAVGFEAGGNLTTGSHNIYIGNAGVRVESGAIRIGTTGISTKTLIAGISGATVPAGVAVIVDVNGHLGTTTSSAHFKEAIKPMDNTSEAILALKPVTFRYKHDLDPEGVPQFGLVAEDVEKVNPDLVARDEQGKPYTVRYDAVNAMLLNEFLKEHRKVQEQDAMIARQQKQIETLAAGLQKLSAQLELSKAAPQAILNSWKQF